MGVGSRERRAFASAAKLRGPVERAAGRRPRGGAGGARHRLPPAPLRSPSPCRCRRGREGSAGSRRVSGAFRGTGKHACAAAAPEAAGLWRGNTRSHTLTHTHAGKEETAVQSQNGSGTLRSANLL